MIKIRCVVERITYQNPENGYSVLKCAVKNYNELVTVVGNLVDVNVGSVLLIDGNWKVDAKYGRQFLAESWEETMAATVFGIEKYLGSGLIKGVGPKFAKKIDMNSNSKYRFLFLSTKRHMPIRINAITVIVPYTADTLDPPNAKNGLSIIRRLPQWFFAYCEGNHPTVNLIDRLHNMYAYFIFLFNIQLRRLQESHS